MPDLVIQGLAACDTTRKARGWLTAHAIAHRFHDLREDGLDRARLERWADAAGWEKVLNRSSTTWRGLPADQKADLDREAAITLILEHPTLVKRPVLEVGSAVLVGFSESVWAEVLGRPPAATA